jgi:hypothetical protein
MRCERSYHSMPAGIGVFPSGHDFNALFSCCAANECRGVPGLQSEMDVPPRAQGTSPMAMGCSHSRCLAMYVANDMLGPIPGVFLQVDNMVYASSLFLSMGTMTVDYTRLGSATLSVDYLTTCLVALHDSNFQRMLPRLPI